MHMRQLLPFALNMVIVAWLRTAVVTRRRSNSIYCWCVELGFGVLIVLPLLGG
jgi:hypothetical protein